jgi:hypothetical protein
MLAGCLVRVGLMYIHTHVCTRNISFFAATSFDSPTVCNETVRRCDLLFLTLSIPRIVPPYIYSHLTPTAPPFYPPLEMSLGQDAAARVS